MNYIGAGRLLKKWRGGGGTLLIVEAGYTTTFFSQHGTFARKFNKEALAR